MSLSWQHKSHGFSLSLPGVVKITLDDANLIADAELVFDTKLVWVWQRLYAHGQQLEVAVYCPRHHHTVAVSRSWRSVAGGNDTWPVKPPSGWRLRRWTETWAREPKQKKGRNSMGLVVLRDLFGGNVQPSDWEWRRCSSIGWLKPR